MRDAYKIKGSRFEKRWWHGQYWLWAAGVPCYPYGAVLTTRFLRGW